MPQDNKAKLKNSFRNLKEAFAVEADRLHGWIGGMKASNSGRGKKLGQTLRDTGTNAITTVVNGSARAMKHPLIGSVLLLGAIHVIFRGIKRFFANRSLKAKIQEEETARRIAEEQAQTLQLEHTSQYLQQEYGPIEGKHETYWRDKISPPAQTAHSTHPGYN